MKNALLITSLLSLAAFAGGCKPSTEAPATPATATAAQQIDKAQAATKDAAQDIQNYAYAQKAEFVTSMKAKLADLDRSLDELSTKLEKSTDAVKAEAKPKLEALRAQSAQLTKQLEAVQGATETTWDAVKVDAQKTYTSMKEGFNQARQWVSDKIAP